MGFTKKGIAMRAEVETYGLSEFYEPCVGLINIPVKSLSTDLIIKIYEFLLNAKHDEDEVWALEIGKHGIDEHGRYAEGNSTVHIRLVEAFQ